MTTGRTVAFLITALLFYAFGNQTQIGWLYVIAAVMAGLVVVGKILNHGALRGITGTRLIRIGDSETRDLFEDDPVNVRLHLHRQRGTPTFQIRLDETCPFAPVHQRVMPVYAPMIPVKEAVTFEYATIADRRGVFAFDPLPAQTKFPFGFFRTQRNIDLPTRTIIYPLVRPLHRFPLFERHLAAEIAYSRSGHGSEIIGVRPYRPGDSPRHIHWRSVARTGQMISKEFAEETRPSLTLLTDTYYPASNASKHTAFEWGIKCAVSIADYARSRGYPIHLASSDKSLPAPSGAVAWDTLLQYMARLQPTQHRALSEAIGTSGLQRFIAMTIVHPVVEYAAPLIELAAKGYTVMPILMDSRTFEETREQPSDIDSLAAALAEYGIDSILVRFGIDWTAQIAGIAHAPISQKVEVENDAANIHSAG